MRRIGFVLASAALAACAQSPTSPDSTTAAVNIEAASRADAGFLVYGLRSDNSLVTFNTAQPNRVLREFAVTGIAAGTRLVGIDFRPSDLNNNGINDVGKFYGLANDGTLYLISTETGEATRVSRLTVAPQGTAFGLGFNPVPDRLRVHSSTGQNLRINVDNGVTAADTVLTYAAGDAGFGTAPALVGAAYTNNDNDPATGTQLYAIDAARNVLVFLAAPNSGRMTTVGALGVPVGPSVGFDIAGTGRGPAFAVISAGQNGASSNGASLLYTIDLDTGRARPVGALGRAVKDIVSIAVAP